MIALPLVPAAEIELMLKVGFAALLGFAVGVERELMGSFAGDRTFSLVTLGSALFTALSFEVFGELSGDAPGRIAANIVTGIGFLGGGMILKEAGGVRGLTTAAGMWSMAGVGMAVGTDRYATAIVVTLVIMGVFSVERLFSIKRSARRRQESP